nr:hypothetical protein [Tanacetum cinerariifolium]
SKSSKGTKSQPKSSGKSVHMEEPKFEINDFEDMLLLVVQNQITNLSGDDVADFIIALRMFTRSLVIQKRVEDLQLGVESYQKQINVTEPVTIRPDLRKRHPDKVLKLKNLKKDATLKLSSYHIKKSMSMLIRKLQDHKMGRLQDDAKRLCLVDDLKKLKDHIHVKAKELSQSKVKDHYIKSQVQERCNTKAFKLSYQEKYEHVDLEVTRSQDGEITR